MSQTEFVESLDTKNLTPIEIGGEYDPFRKDDTYETI